MKFKISQSGTHNPLILSSRLDIRTPPLTAIRVSEGYYVINVPHTANLIGGGFTAHSSNRMIHVKPHGAQIMLYVYENNTPNTTGGLYADNFWGYISLYYKNNKPDLRSIRPLIAGFRIKEGSRLLGQNQLYGDPPTIEEAFADFHTRIGVLNECTVQNFEIVNSRYVIKGYGNLLRRGYTVGAFSFQKASNKIEFKRDGKDIILRYIAVESPDDEQTYFVKDSILSEVMVFVELKPRWRRPRWGYRRNTSFFK